MSLFEFNITALGDRLKLVNAEEQIDRRCIRADTDKKSSFIITGRGGLPSSPNEPLQGESVITNWVTLDSQEDQFKDTTSGDRTAKSNTLASHPPNPVTSAAPSKDALVEAQGWVYGSNGEVILTAEAPRATPQSPSLMPANCQSDRSDAP